MRAGRRGGGKARVSGGFGLHYPVPNRVARAELFEADAAKLPRPFEARVATATEAARDFTGNATDQAGSIIRELYFSASRAHARVRTPGHEGMRPRLAIPIEPVLNPASLNRHGTPRFPVRPIMDQGARFCIPFAIRERSARGDEPRRQRPRWPARLQEAVRRTARGRQGCRHWVRRAGPQSRTGRRAVPAGCRRGEG